MAKSSKLVFNQIVLLLVSVPVEANQTLSLHACAQNLINSHECMKFKSVQNDKLLSE